MSTTKKAIPVKLTSDVKHRDRPVGGALYRAKRSSSAHNGIKKDDLVMVVSELPYLKDKKYEKVFEGSAIFTTVQEWVDLVILYNETMVTMDGTTESTWYYWFERAEQPVPHTSSSM